MVKHDHFPGVVSWLAKIGGLLPLAICLYAVWKLFSTWLSLDPVSEGLAICEVIATLGMGPLIGKALFKGEEWQQLKQVESLRRNQKELALYPIQPKVDKTKDVLPIVLSTHLSPVIYLGFTAFWLAALGETLYLTGSSPDAAGSRAIFIVTWLLLGAITIILAGTGKYQRIEATTQGLVIQRGFKRRAIPWEQARLFAAVRLMNPDSMPAQYELSSSCTLLRWGASYPTGGVIASPRQPQEYEKRLCALLSSIRVHTGLPLLDLR